MSKPRKVIPGRTYLLTRRCVSRRFLLTPSVQEINEIFLFCLAHAAAKYRVELHAAVCLGNHYHIVATDLEGRTPRFMHWFNEFVAKCVNVERGRWGALWEPEGYSAVVLVENDDVLDKMLYTLANPVEAGLVRYGNEWPGFRSDPDDFCRRVYVARRPRFFSPTGDLPERVKVRFVKPRRYAHLTDGEYRELVTEKCEVREKAIQDRFRREGRKFLGVLKVRTQNPEARPASHEETRGMNPRIACKRKWPRIEAIAENERFQKEYRSALERHRNGEKDVVFPEGTWWMRVFFKVRCHPLP